MKFLSTLAAYQDEYSTELSYNSLFLDKETNIDTCHDNYSTLVISLIGFNPLLHRLFLDHDIIFYFKTTLKKKSRII